MLVDRYLTELSLLAKDLCPEAKIEATCVDILVEKGVFICSAVYD